jgi:hypothetical protein
MSRSEPVQEATTTRAQEMLLDFLRDHDAACPVCGYNLRALTRPICPECGHALMLTVGATRLRIGWLLAAVAPGFFSGIAALFVLFPTFGQFNGDRRLSRLVMAMILLDLFGWCSLLFAILLASRLKRFIAQPRSRQRWWALGIWAVHIAAFVCFVLSAVWFL